MVGPGADRPIRISVFSWWSVPNYGAPVKTQYIICFKCYNNNIKLYYTILKQFILFLFGLKY